MSKQDLFTVWWLTGLIYVIIRLSVPDLSIELRQQSSIAFLIIGNMFYLISQSLRDESDR